MRSDPKTPWGFVIEPISGAACKSCCVMTEEGRRTEAAKGKKSGMLSIVVIVRVVRWLWDGYGMAD